MIWGFIANYESRAQFPSCRQYSGRGCRRTPADICLGLHLVLYLRDDPIEDVAFISEIRIQLAFRYPGSSRNVGRAGLGVAFLEEDLGCGSEDPRLVIGA